MKLHFLSDISIFSPGWLTVTKDEYIPVDLETQELQITTDSALGSGNEIKLLIYDSSTPNIAGFFIQFEAALTYHVGKCTEDGTNDKFGEGASQSVPTEDKEKIWRITETAGSLRVW